MTPPLLEVRDLFKVFPRRRGLFRDDGIEALRGVSFDIARGETFGLVGESGSGKTTAARCLLRLIEPTGGAVHFDGRNVLALSRRDMRALRRRMQIVFQDPFASLNPRLRAGAIVEEPLIVHRIGSRAERQERVARLFALVGLDPAFAARYPHELSGGERQRIGIARALVLEPSFVVADEPVSALDVSVQAQVVDLLMDLQRQLGLTCLLIAHDLRLVQHVCRRVAVMFGGRIVEMGDTGSLFVSPAHPYTRALLEAAPALDPDARRNPLAVKPAPFEPGLPLREIAPGHYARVPAHER